MSVDFPSFFMRAEEESSSTSFDASSTEISESQCVSSSFLPIIHRVDTTAQLIVFWSKALLRHPQARSSLEEMTTDTAFQRYIPDHHPDNLVPPNEIRKHILCTGLYSRLDGTAVNVIFDCILQVKSITPSFRSAKTRASTTWQSAGLNRSHLSPTIWSVLNNST